MKPAATIAAVLGLGCLITTGCGGTSVAAPALRQHGTIQFGTISSGGKSLARKKDTFRLGETVSWKVHFTPALSNVNLALLIGAGCRSRSLHVVRRSAPPPGGETYPFTGSDTVSSFYGPLLRRELESQHIHVPATVHLCYWDLDRNQKLLESTFRVIARR